MTALRNLTCAAAFAAGALTLVTGAGAQSPLGAPLFAVLNGGNECDGTSPPNGPVCRKGDPDAIGSATILFPNATTVCFAIIVDNLAGATLAHIHSGVAGVNGGIVVTLVPPSAPGAGNPGASSGCVAVAPGIVGPIRNDPTKFYVNVHNGAFSGGAVRGQLH
ncbi:MAG: CHRD domain-containing protein [Beijerinckiaceae bacterium]|nr:CHRD domain-containing protein [Beijerinckiaceae bacterium]